MPELDGLEFLRIVREEMDSNIPFIIFTGKGREEVAMEALNLGADRYLQKGGDPKTQFWVLSQAVVQEVDRYFAEKERKKVERRLTAICRSSPASITLSTLEEGQFVHLNQAFSEYTGFDEDEVIGKTALELDIWAEPKEKQRKKFVNSLKNKGSIRNQEYRFRNKEGLEMVGLLSAEIIELEGQRYILTNVVDITDRKKMEKKLRESKAEIEERNEELRVINSIAESLHGSVDVDTVASRAVDVMKDYTGSPAIMLVRIEENRKTITKLDACGFLEKDYKAPPELHLNDSLSGEAIREGRVMVSEDVVNDSRIHKQARKVLESEGFQSVVLVPIQA